ncbi:MAG: hypothetical protein J6Y77_08010 [Paludibacteraceae bacterium]|nr:hypothetical protein [Paludibacteraceae bacterium]
MTSVLRYGLIVLWVLTNHFACDRIKMEMDRQPVMELNGKVLYKDHIESILPSGLSTEDSLSFVENYKRQWAITQLMYDKAATNIGSTQEIDELTEIYRKELLINAYEQQLIGQISDKVSDDSVFHFYELEKGHFKLDEALYKGIYIKLTTTAPDQSQLSKWLSDPNDENLENIMHYCTKYAVFYDFFTEDWIRHSKVMAFLPQPIDAHDPALLGGTVVQQTDEYSYYLHLTDIIAAGQPEPYEHIKNELRQIIQNRQRVGYLQKFKEELYENAVNSKQIVFYNENSTQP